MDSNTCLYSNTCLDETSRITMSHHNFAKNNTNFTKLQCHHDFFDFVKLTYYPNMQYNYVM